MRDQHIKLGAMKFLMSGQLPFGGPSTVEMHCDPGGQPLQFRSGLGVNQFISPSATILILSPAATQSSVFIHRSVKSSSKLCCWVDAFGFAVGGGEVWAQRI